jgi:hypothetical protein
MAGGGEQLLKLARKHVGEKYILGARTPKDNSRWTGPWDCAEFASWLVFQTARVLYGCDNDAGDPAAADAYTGYWQRDADAIGQQISIAHAAATPGAAVLRVPLAGATGHIVISDGLGGTVEAHSTKRGVIEATLSDRRWDMGILVPGITYTEGSPVVMASPRIVVYRLALPRMTGNTVKAIQRRLRENGFNPGPVDGEFGPQTQAAVLGFQAARGLVQDGEVGPRTAKSLGVELEPV